MTAEQFAKNLIKGAGADRAIKIAEERMRATSPKNFDGLPKGTIFFPEDVRQTSGYREKDLQKLHNSWVHIYHVLKKMGVKR
jgi:hypothetical protein